MTFAHAKKLHNGDEVIDKVSGESVKVLSTEVVDDGSYGTDAVLIMGIGDKQGYATWHHKMVK